MAAAVGLRFDYSAAGLRGLARRSRDGNQVRRLLTMATIYEGGTRSEAARVGGVGLQTVRDWVLRFNAAGPDGLVDGIPPGGIALLNDAQRRALAAIVESGPIPASHGVVRWRLIDLAQWVWDEFRVSISKQTLSRELRAMATRPRHHAQDADAMPAFKKTYGSPRLQVLYDRCLNSLRQRIRSQGNPWPRWSSARSDPHNFLGGSRHFFNQDFGTPFDSQAIFHNHMQISSAALAGGDRCRLRG